MRTLSYNKKFRNSIFPVIILLFIFFTPIAIVYIMHSNLLYKSDTGSIIKLHKGEYVYSTIKLNGTIIFFMINSINGTGIGYIENDGYVIPIFNLIGSYDIGDIIETNSTIVRDNFVFLNSIFDRKIGRKNKIEIKKELSVDDINRNYKNYDWMLFVVKNAFIENINITSVLSRVRSQKENYIVKINIKGLNMDSYYIGPKINIEIGKTYNLLATIVKSNNTYTLRIFDIY
jgi:hypothetical protein